jgi:hypothetical protein
MFEKQPLVLRYNSVFLAAADSRRSRLDYKPLHVGKSTTSRTDRILALLYQTHQNYYFGHFNASCILAGVLFEQCLICLLEEEIELQGKITCKHGKDVVTIDDPGGLINQSLQDLIKVATYYHIIPREHYQGADELRLIRNYLMHDDLGVFMKSGENYEFTLGVMTHGVFVGNPISIPIVEVKDHCLTTESQEIWAYYLLTRTRHLIEHMFEERVKRLPPEKVAG